jgi:hypothetical protein
MPSTPAQWQVQRVLDFLNAAENATTITASPLLQDADGNGYVIGKTVAQRILDIRQGLRSRQFRSWEELEAVPGLGADKLNDLLTSLAVSADRFFLEQLFDGPLLENWVVSPLSEAYSDAASFREQVSQAVGVKQVAARLLSGDYSPTSDDAQRFEHLAIRGAFAEYYPVAHLAAFQLAYWFYLYDYDNWFSFEQMRGVCEQYLSYHRQAAHRLELWLLKGFNQLPEEAINYRHILPVVVNHGERKVTVWQVQLLD